MSRKNGFVPFSNKFGKLELINSSKISMIYCDDDELFYTVLFDDGSEIILDLPESEVETLIKRIVVLDGI